ncbi:hypothetical protein J4209_01780 [Candidatus Woesearchaeota archaeon]|nr:hypothetical protein [Candidatus Woesearchaeota archaeon]
MPTDEKLVKVKKKRWCQIIGPKIFRDTILGETAVIDPNMLINRALTVNLMTLTNDIKKQNINVSFLINKVEGDNAFADITGYEISSSYIKRMVRKGRGKIDMSFVCSDMGNKKIRIKMLVISKAILKSSVLSLMRRTIIEYLSDFIKKTNFDNLIMEAISTKLQHSLKDSLKKIYPLRVVEIREIRIETEKKPKEKSKKKGKKQKEEPKEEKKEVKEKAEKEEKVEGEEVKEERKEKPKKKEKREEVKKGALKTEEEEESEEQEAGENAK